MMATIAIIRIFLHLLFVHVLVQTEADRFESEDRKEQLKKQEQLNQNSKKTEILGYNAKISLPYVKYKTIFTSVKNRDVTKLVEENKIVFKIYDEENVGLMKTDNVEQNEEVGTTNNQSPTRLNIGKNIGNMSISIENMTKKRETLKVTPPCFSTTKSSSTIKQLSQQTRRTKNASLQKTSPNFSFSAKITPTIETPTEQTAVATAIKVAMSKQTMTVMRAATTTTKDPKQVMVVTNTTMTRLTKELEQAMVVTNAPLAMTRSTKETLSKQTREVLPKSTSSKTTERIATQVKGIKGVVKDFSSVDLNLYTNEVHTVDNKGGDAVPEYIDVGHLYENRGDRNKRSESVTNYADYDNRQGHQPESNLTKPDQIEGKKLPDLIQLIQQLSLQIHMDGLIIFSREEDLRNGHLFHLRKDLSQIHLNRVPRRLKLKGNLMRTLVIIIIDNHFELLRNLSTARNNFFTALYPTAAILIVLPTCLPEIRENLSAFILLRMWRHHGLHKLIVACHETNSLTPIERPQQPKQKPPKQHHKQEKLYQKPKQPHKQQVKRQERQASEQQSRLLKEEPLNDLLQTNEEIGDPQEKTQKEDHNIQDQNLSEGELENPIVKELNMPQNSTKGKLLRKLLTDQEITPTLQCGLLIWILNPFKSCIDSQLTQEVLKWLWNMMSQIPSDISNLSEKGQDHYNPNPTAHLGPKLSFGANFDSLYSPIFEVNDEQCHKMQTVLGSRKPLTEVFRILKSRFLNMQGCHFDLSIYHRIPTAIVRSNDTRKRRIDGMDGQILFLLGKSMNFTPRLHISEDRILYGLRRVGSNTTQGTFVDILSRKVNMNMNGHFIKHYNSNRIAFTRFITTDLVCLSLPKAPQVSPLKTVLLSFDWPVWAGLGLTFVTLVLLFYAWHYALRHAFPWKRVFPLSSNLDSVILLELYRTMLNLPSSSIFSLARDSRLLLGFLFAFSFIVTNAFQGTLFTFISNPVYYPDINTFAELDASGLTLWSSSSGWEELFIEDPHLENIGKRLFYRNESEIRNSTARFVQFQRINSQSKSLFRDVRMRTLHNATRLLHVMDDTLITYFVSYVMLKESPYRIRIDQLLSWIDQAGLVHKWMQKVERSLLTRLTPLRRTRGAKDEKGATIFGLEDLKAPFMLLFAGQTLSCVVLLMELMFRKWKRYTTTRKVIQFAWQHKPDQLTTKKFPDNKDCTHIELNWPTSKSSSKSRESSDQKSRIKRTLIWPSLDMSPNEKSNVKRILPAKVGRTESVMRRSEKVLMSVRKRMDDGNRRKVTSTSENGPPRLVQIE